MGKRRRCWSSEIEVAVVVSDDAARRHDVDWDASFGNASG